MPGKIRHRPTPPEFIARRLEGVPLTFLNGDGKQVKEEFTLEVRSYTAYGFLKLQTEIEGKTFAGEEHLECEMLSRTVTAIIDSDGEPLTEEDGQPAQLTAAFFSSLLQEDRDAISNAMKDDANPQTASASAGSGGSNPEVKQA